MDGIPVLDGKKIPELKKLTSREHAIFMFLEMMKNFVSAAVFNDAEMSVLKGKSVSPFTMETRQNGKDFTYQGDTMTGWKRLDNLLFLFMILSKTTLRVITLKQECGEVAQASLPKQLSRC